eukprot:5105562-Pyramimonas_sp.AAC.1
MTPRSCRRRTSLWGCSSWARIAPRGAASLWGRALLRWRRPLAAPGIPIRGICSSRSSSRSAVSMT